MPENDRTCLNQVLYSIMSLKASHAARRVRCWYPENEVYMQNDWFEVGIQRLQDWEPEFWSRE